MLMGFKGAGLENTLHFPETVGKIRFSREAGC